MKGWLNNKQPLSAVDLIRNTDKKRVLRAYKEVRPVSYKVEFIIKKLPLWKRIPAFFSKDPVSTLFEKLTVETRNIKNGHRHFVIIVFPHLKDMDSQVLSTLPIKVYSTTPDFKFRFAWELNESNNLFTDEVIEKDLGIALTQKPKDVVPLDSKQLDKHLYGVLTRIDSFRL